MNYHNITKCDMLNGNGLRVVLWVSGCDHNCKGCHNPQTHNPDSGILFDSNAKKELFEELEKDWVTGITFSGGDPLYEENRHTIFRLINEIKEKYPNKNIWLYTGYKIDKVVKIVPRDILSKIDIIVDGPFIMDLKDVTLHFRGSSNQKINNIKEMINNGDI